MLLFHNKWLKLFKMLKRAHLFLLTAVILTSILLAACGTGKTSTAQPPLVLTPLATSTQASVEATSTAAPANPSAPEATATVAAASPTATSAALPSDTATPAPTGAATATPAPTATAATPTASIPSIFYPSIPEYYYNLVADIQNNVNGILQVLNVSGDNGQAYIIITNTYSDRKYQYDASYNLFKYLATYFKGLSKAELAKLFNGAQFAFHIKSISIDNEFIVDTTTPYDVLQQIAQSQADEGQWEGLVDAQIQMQYHVTALCSVTPKSIPANTDTPILVSAWLLYKGKPVQMQYVTAAWKDSNSVQIYCAGNQYDSSCHGHSGPVTSGTSITINVDIQAVDGLKYTCQTSCSAP